MSNKQAIIDNFQILVKYYKQENDTWRVRAYNNAIIALKKLPISDIRNINQVKNVPNIGKQSLAKINEYLETGEIEKVQEVKKLLVKETENDETISKNRILGKFSSILGAGEKTAEKWWNSGMRSFEDLQKNKHLLTHQQKIGLKYYNDLQKRIPREYIDTFQVMIRYILAKEIGLDNYKMQVAGSYRRGNSNSGDIDILITSKKTTLRKIVDVLKEWKVITDVISMKDEKFMGIAHCPSGKYFYFHVDIVFINMRARAKKMGYTLNQKGLFDQNGDQIKAFTEKEIMYALKMNWVPPEKR
jgi:DNA polymerase beta